MKPTQLPHPGGALPFETHTATQETAAAVARPLKKPLEEMLMAAAETLVSAAAISELLSTENYALQATGHVRVITVAGVDVTVCLCVSCLRTPESQLAPNGR
jgi:hypothetical protein